MKSRHGYVSNSSSSSFVVIGRKAGNLFGDKIDLDNGKQHYLVGACFDEGDDIMSLTPELAKWVVEHHAKNDRYGVDEINGDVIEAEFSVSEPYGDECPAIPKGSSVWCFTADHHSTYDVKSAEENYPEKEEKQE